LTRVIPVKSPRRSLTGETTCRDWKNDHDRCEAEADKLVRALALHEPGREQAPTSKL
jgi:hypothetical protein